MSHYLTKSRFLDGRNCPKSLWLSSHHYDLGVYDQSFAGEMGDEVGKLATTYFKEGQQVNSPYNRHDAAVDETSQYLEDQNIKAIYEAAFTFDAIRIRVDILKRDKEGWSLIEVKSSKELKDHFLYDIGIQYYVLSSLGLKINSAQLMFIDGSYEFKKELDLKKLFQFHDFTKEVKDNLDTLVSEIQRLKKVQESEEPSVEPTKSLCSGCAFWKHCTQHKPKDWIINIPRLHKTKLERLTAMGIDSMSEIPNDFELPDSQRKVVESTKDQTSFLNKEGLKKDLGSIKPPVYYFDFEALSSAIPFIDQIKPYDSVPFQWSLHLNIDFKKIHHHYFLAEKKEDFRKELITQFIQKVGNDDYPIVVYNMSYEKTRLKELAILYPELAGQIEQIINRFVDLMLVIKDNYYDYRLYGSYSLKNVLPVLTSEEGYGELEGVQDGNSAQSQFYKLLNGDIPKDQIQNTRDQLLKYCEKDTFSLIQLHEKLLELVK